MFYRPHSRVRLDCGDELITKQDFKAECDIHNILKQFQKTGIITHVQSARPTYEDLPSEVDFQASLHVIMQAEEAFAGLPSTVRSHFDNDPSRFLGAFSDPSQADKLREFGLLKPLPPTGAPLASEGSPAASGGST